MSLLICVRSIKDGDRELCLYRSRGEYKIRYENRNQNTTFKSKITDIGYANYLFDMFAKDLHMEDNLIDKEDMCDDIGFLKERIDKYRISLIKNKNGNNKARVNRRSNDIGNLISIQNKITEIILENYGEFKISESKLNEFIENQNHIRKCIGEKDYSKTSYGSKLNEYFKSIDLLNSEKFKVWEDKEIVEMFNKEIEKVETNLKNEVEMLLNCNKS